MNYITQTGHINAMNHDDRVWKHMYLWSFEGVFDISTKKQRTTYAHKWWERNRKKKSLQKTLWSCSGFCSVQF